MDNNDNLKKLIAVLNEANPDTINGCVILHFDKETEELKSISPMVPFKSVDDMYTKLRHAENAIHNLLEDFVNKGLYKGGQLS